MNKKINCDGKCSFLSFKLDKNVFAVSVKKVLEVLEKQEITLVPNAPEYFKGVLNFRGEILTVLDLRKKFHFTNSNDFKYVIIVLEILFGDKKILTGAVVDKVVDVLSTEPEKIKDIPEMGSHFNTDFIIGMIKENEDIITILDIDKVFEKHEMEMVNKLMENKES